MSGGTTCLDEIKNRMCSFLAFFFPRWGYPDIVFLLNYFSVSLQEGEAGKENPDVKPSQSGGFINDPKVRYIKIFSP